MTRLDRMGTLFSHILEDMNPHEHIVAGSFINNETDIKFQDNINGINVVNERLRYIAIRGKIADWAIYVNIEKLPDSFILNNGVKVHDLNIVKQLVRCDDSALALYRK